MNGDQNSFGFYAGRQTASRIAVQRFGTGGVPLLVGAVYDCANTSTDLLDALGSNRESQLKDISLGVYLPIDKVDDVVDLTKTTIVGLRHSYTFYISINRQTVQYPVTFEQNVQTMRSPLWLASFPDVVKSLTVRVRVDDFNAAWAGYTVNLDTLLEFYCVTPA